MKQIHFLTLFIYAFYLTSCSTKLHLNREVEIQKIKVKTTYSNTFPETLIPAFDSSFARKVKQYNSSHGYISWVPVSKDSSADLNFNLESVRTASPGNRSLSALSTAALFGLAIVTNIPIYVVVLPRCTTGFSLNYNPFYFNEGKNFSKRKSLYLSVMYWTGQKRQEKRLVKGYGNYTCKVLSDLERDYLLSKKKDPEVRHYLRRLKQRTVYLGMRFGFGESYLTSSLPFFENYQRDAAFLVHWESKPRIILSPDGC